MSRPKRSGLPTITHIEDTREDGTTERVLIEEWWDDILKEGYTMIPNVVLRSSLGLDAHSKMVLLHLMVWLQKSDPGAPLPGDLRVKNLARWTGMSKSTVQRSLKVLTERGFVYRHGDPGSVSHFLLALGPIIEAAWTHEYDATIDR
jgi:predicted transcriptional regulator